MSIILPNSLFLHAGRTGGHWVSHVLWRGGLVHRRLFPLHVTLQQIGTDADVIARPFRFCFVRHPLHWLASVWKHEMEFGWSPSSIHKAAFSEEFPTFLRQMLNAWPDGPCSLHLQPYIDASVFVGRTESITADLTLALKKAGEIFDPAILSVPPQNVSETATIKNAAKAPRALLAEVMSAEALFNRTYDYQDIPESLASELRAPQIWPAFALKPGHSVNEIERAITLGHSTVRFDYAFSSGERIYAEGWDRRSQLAMIEVIRSTPARKKCAVISEFDPYFAYLLKQSGFGLVTFVCNSSHILPLRIMSVIDEEILVIEHKEFMQQYSQKYDIIIMQDSFEVNAAAENELIRFSMMLEAGGLLLLSVPVLRISSDIALKTACPMGHEMRYGTSLCYYSFGYMKNFLENLGFADVECVYNQGESTGMEKAYVDALATVLGKDPEQLLGKTIIRAVMQHENANDDPILARLKKFYVCRQPLDATNAPLDSMAELIQATIATLSSELRDEKRRRTAAEFGLSEREQELNKARRDLATNITDADHSREQMRRARQETLDTLSAYDLLRKRLRIIMTD